MYERRRQAASLASLLVVSCSFVWACSSGVRDEVVGTTSGGAGLASSLDSNLPPDNSEGGALSESGGLAENGSTGSTGSGGSGSDSDPGVVVPDPGDPTPGDGTSGSAQGGSGNSNVAGAPSTNGGAPSAGSGNPGVAGAVNAGAGAPPIVEKSCTPEESDSGGTALPCAVFSALSACRNCHSNPTVKGVQHPYVTFANIKPRAAALHDLIKSGVMPLPPYTMTSQQKATVIAWLGKDGSCAIGAATSCN